MTRWQIDKSGVFGKSDTPFLFTFTQKQRAMLLAVSRRLQWDSTFDAALSDNERAIVDDLIYKLMEDESMDEIANAIMYLADRLPAPAQCCGALDTAVGLPDGTNSTEFDYEGDPPEGYLDWDAYNLAKCKDANWMADKIIDMVAVLGGSSLAALSTLTIGAIAALMGIFFPPAWMAVATSYVIFAAASQLLIIGAASGFGAFNTLGIQLSSNRAALVQVLYNWTSGTGLIASLLAHIETEAIAAGISAATAEKLKTYFDKFFTGNVINDYIANIGTNAPASYTPITDCSVYDEPIMYLRPGTDCRWVDTDTFELRPFMSYSTNLAIKSALQTYGNHFVFGDIFNDAAGTTTPAGIDVQIASMSGWATMNNTNYDYTYKTRYATTWTIHANRGADLNAQIGITRNCRNMAAGGGNAQWQITWARV